jgi:hypothetical protein
MTNPSNDRIDLYNERLQLLYDNVLAWLKESGVVFTPLFEDQSLTEENLGNYRAKKLTLKQDDRIMARFIPIGILIIGAEGRVDLFGKSGKEILVYFSEGGPEMSTRMSVGDMAEERTGKIYGQKREGWHWIDDRITGRQPELTKEILLALLDRIN